MVEVHRTCEGVLLRICAFFFARAVLLSLPPSWTRRAGCPCRPPRCYEFVHGVHAARLANSPRLLCIAVSPFFHRRDWWQEHKIHATTNLPAVCAQLPLDAVNRRWSPKLYSLFASTWSLPLQWNFCSRTNVLCSSPLAGQSHDFVALRPVGHQVTTSANRAALASRRTQPSPVPGGDGTLIANTAHLCTSCQRDAVATLLQLFVGRSSSSCDLDRLETLEAGRAYTWM